MCWFSDRFLAPFTRGLVPRKRSNLEDLGSAIDASRVPFVCRSFVTHLLHQHRVGPGGFHGFPVGHQWLDELEYTDHDLKMIFWWYVTTSSHVDIKVKIIITWFVSWLCVNSMCNCWYCGKWSTKRLGAFSNNWWTLFFPLGTVFDHLHWYPTCLVVSWTDSWLILEANFRGFIMFYCQYHLINLP